MAIKVFFIFKIIGIETSMHVFTAIKHRESNSYFELIQCKNI